MEAGSLRRCVVGEVDFKGALQSLVLQVFVNMAEDMAESGFDQLFPVEAWPEVPATSEIATKKKAMKAKCGHNHSFIYTELKK